MPLQAWLLGNTGGWPSANVYDNCQLVPTSPVDPGGVSIHNKWVCSARDVLPSLLPGLLNLGAGLWILSPQRSVRLAATLALILGAVRLVVPALTYIAMDPVSIRTTFWPGPNLSMATSVILWFVSLGATMRFHSLTGAE
jgi:hypothetical protein